jgi:hypothetical protein
VASDIVVRRASFRMRDASIDVGEPLDESPNSNTTSARGFLEGSRARISFARKIERPSFDGSLGLLARRELPALEPLAIHARRRARRPRIRSHERSASRVSRAARRARRSSPTRRAVREQVPSLGMRDPSCVAFVLVTRGRRWTRSTSRWWSFRPRFQPSRIPRRRSFRERTPRRCGGGGDDESAVHAKRPETL